MDLCGCGCGGETCGGRFLRGHSGRVYPRPKAVPPPSRKGYAKAEGPIRNARLIDKPARWPGVRSLSLKNGASQGGRLYWYTKYPAADKAAKDRAYQIARESAEVVRLLIVNERVE